MEALNLRGWLKNPKLKSIVENLTIGYCFLFLAISVLGILPLYSFAIPKVPTSLLVVREALFFLVISFFALFFSKRFFLITFFVALSFLFVELLTTSGFSILLVFGFKSLLPMVFLFSVPDEDAFRFDEKRFLQLVKILFFINLGLQLIHLFFANGYYARYMFDLNARNPGLFYFPAASAFFTTILFAIYVKRRAEITLKEISIFILSVALCASLTGMGGACAILALNYKKITRENRFVTTLWIVISFVNLHFARMAMTGMTYLEETAGGRIGMFKDMYAGMQLSPENFGAYTNAASNYSNGFIADSSISAMLGNLGTMWACIFGALFLIFLVINYYKRNDVQILIVVLVSAFGLNITETGISIFLAVIARFILSESPQSNALKV